MDQICGHRDTSSPACLIDSSVPDENTGLFYHHHHDHLYVPVITDLSNPFTNRNQVSANKSCNSVSIAVLQTVQLINSRICLF